MLCQTTTGRWLFYDQALHYDRFDPEDESGAGLLTRAVSSPLALRSSRHICQYA